jgi:hypothetical protein
MSMGAINPMFVAMSWLTPGAAAALATSPKLLGWLVKTANRRFKDKASMAAAITSLNQVAEDDPEAAPAVMEILGALAGMNESTATADKDREAFGD